MKQCDAGWWFIDIQPDSTDSFTDWMTGRHQLNIIVSQSTDFRCEMKKKNKYTKYKCQLKSIIQEV